MSKIKACFVPTCANNTKKNPNKMYLVVPQNLIRRKIWFQAIGVQIKRGNNWYCCEDHFDLKNDAENWIFYKTAGSQLKLKQDVVPHLNLQKYIKSHESQLTPPPRESRTKIFKQIDNSTTKQALFLQDKILANNINSTNKIVFIDGGEIRLENELVVKNEIFEDSVSIKQELIEEDGSMIPHSFQFLGDLNTKIIKIEEEILKGSIITEQESIEEEIMKMRQDKKPLDEIVGGLEQRDSINLKSEQIKHEKILNTEFIIKDEILDESVSEHSQFPIENEGFSCDVCNKIFAHRKNFNQHLRIHSVEKPFSCDVCDKTFRQKIGLIQHKRIHTGERPFACDFCDKAFAQCSALKSHKLTHTREKHFSCEFCDKAFIRKDMLIRHERSHTREKDLSCNFCYKSFIRRGCLNKHLRIHEVNSEENTFSCDICNKTFTRVSDVYRHKRNIHTEKKPFSCNVCNKTFRIKSFLNNHRRIHTGEKPFSCDICEKSFNQRRYLAQHIAIHKKNFLW